MLDGLKVNWISMQGTAQNVQNLEHRGARGVDGLVLWFQIFERLIKAPIIIKHVRVVRADPESRKLVARGVITVDKCPSQALNSQDGCPRSQ